MEGPLGQKLERTTSFLDFVISSKLNYQKKLENWEQVNVIAKDILQKSPDQWNVYLDYITSIFRLVDSNRDHAENVDCTVRDAVGFITFQKENNAKCRGPYLAQIELQSRILARQHADAKQSKIIEIMKDWNQWNVNHLPSGEMCDLLVGYFEKFGSKPCCGSDLKLYLPLLDSNEANRFFEETFKFISFNSETGCPSKVNISFSIALPHKRCTLYTHAYRRPTLSAIRAGIQCLEQLEITTKRVLSSD